MSDSFRLDGKTALVTGGSRGIGRSIALGLAAAGARVVLTYCTQREQAADVVRCITVAGGKASAYQYDASRPGPEVQRVLVGRVRSWYGKIDMLVNNAAMAQEKPFMELTEADWQRMLTVNLTAGALLCQSVLEDMQESGWGRIVNVASIGGQLGGGRQVQYACAKAGVVALTKSLARLYAQDSITVNAVSPGLVQTDMVAQELATDAGQQKVAQIPLGRVATPEEVAAAVVWLCSEEASYVTGHCLNVNGGMLMV